MDSFIYSMNATVPIFLVMILGGIIKKLKIIDDNFVDKANKYVFIVALPAMLFKDISQSDMKTNFDISFVLFCMMVTTVCFVLIWLFSELFMKDDTMKGSFIQGSFRSSAAILGLAFVQNMYSDSGMAPLMIVAAVPLYNIYSVIVLTFKAKRQNEDGRIIEVSNAENIKKACLNIIKNPIIIAIVLGLCSSLLDIKFFVIIDKTIASVASTATPIALIVIGAGFEGRKAIKKIKPTVIASVIKLVLQAGIFLPIAIWMGFRNQELISILIMLASPSTVSCYIMAKSMNNDEVLASSIIVLTTLFSSITLTVWIFVLRMGGFI